MVGEGALVVKVVVSPMFMSMIKKVGHRITSFQTHPPTLPTARPLSCSLSISPSLFEKPTPPQISQTTPKPTKKGEKPPAPVPEPEPEPEPEPPPPLR